MIDIIPVAYAVCYVFGTIGSAYILANLGPWMLGGIKKVKADTAALEKEMNESSLTSDPAYIIANRPVAFRAYSVTSDFFDSPQSVAQIESHLHSQGRRLFIERVRSGHNIIEPTPETRITKGDEIVLSGRREYIIEDESWIGPEVNDAELLDFPAEQIPVMITRKTVAGLTVDELRSQTYMYGVSIKSIDRGGVAIPVLAKTKLMAGDTLTLVGLASEVNTAAPPTRIRRPSQNSIRPHTCRSRHSNRLSDRCTHNSCRQYPGQPQHKRRHSDLRSDFRMAPVETPIIRTHSQGSRMDHEQSWPEHVYRRNRHHIRAIIRQRNQGSGLRTVSGRHSLHIASANTQCHHRA